MTPRRALVIANPASNHGETAKLIPTAAELLSNVIPHELVVTSSPGHARELAAASDGHDLVIALGGDGTVHEVLNGIMQHPSSSRPALSILPTGSGNDYRRTLGIPINLSAAILAIGAGERRSVDVGVCNGVYFANTLAIGLDAQVTAMSVEMKVTTGRTGLPLYLSALMHVLFKEYRTYDVMMSFDGAPEEPRSMTLIAFTHGPTYGGGFYITPQAVGDDGAADICLIDAIPLWQALWRVPFVIPGKHTWMKPVHMLRHASALIRADRPIPGQIDGEVMLSDTYEVSTLERALEVVVPRRAS